MVLSVVNFSIFVQQLVLGEIMLNRYYVEGTDINLGFYNNIAVNELD